MKKTKLEKKNKVMDRIAKKRELSAKRKVGLYLTGLHIDLISKYTQEHSISLNELVDELILDFINQNLHKELLAATTIEGTLLYSK